MFLRDAFGNPNDIAALLFLLEFQIIIVKK